MLNITGPGTFLSSSKGRLFDSTYSDERVVQSVSTPRGHSNRYGTRASVSGGQTDSAVTGVQPMVTHTLLPRAAVEG
jgi:hypothetical protein